MPQCTACGHDEHFQPCRHEQIIRAGWWPQVLSCACPGTHTTTEPERAGRSA